LDTDNLIQQGKDDERDASGDENEEPEEEVTL
jgi:hypothetical protein